MARATLTAAEIALAREGHARQQTGQPVTLRQAAALKKAGRVRDDADRDRLCREFPQAVYCALAGLTPARLYRHAAAHDVPCRGRTIDLAAVLKRLHQILEEHGPQLRRDPAAAATALYRREKARLARLQRLAAGRRLLPREEVHAAFREIASIFRAAAGRIAKDSPDAADILTESIDDALAHPFFAAVDRVPDDARAD